MTAKKITEFVKGKMINQKNDNQINESINIINYHKLSENEEKTQLNELILFKNDKIMEEINDEYILESPSSTKSSPGSKSKWGTQIIDVKNNINTAMEDAYSTLNTLIKGGSPAAVVGAETEVSNIMCTSRTMDDIGKLENLNDFRDLREGSNNKSVEDVFTVNSKIDSINDSAAFVPLYDNDIYDDFKDELRNRKNDFSNDLQLPKYVRKSLIDNFEFPKSRLSLSHENYKIRWEIIIVSLFILTILLMVSLTTFIGFILGAGTCYLLLIYYGIINYELKKVIIKIPKLKDLKSPVIPHIQENNEEDYDLYTSQQSKYSCWVNILGMYDANTYNINQCQVVHLDIEDKILRLRRPKKKIAHRSMWKDGNYHGLTFISEILIDITEVKVGLQPTGLVHKRLWSKKYPICISFPKILCECVSDVYQSFTDILNYKCQEIYFFGRTCRDKEELFRRLLNACNNDTVDYNMWNIVQQYLTRPNESSEMNKSYIRSKSAENINRKLMMADETEDYTKKVTYRNTNKEDEDENEPSVEAFRRKSDYSMPQIAEYVKYMAKFMPSDMFIFTSKVMRLDISYVTCTPELLCINAFLGRMFWDFLRGSHWVDVIRNKIQCKLQKIHLPQFMDELKVMDIHLGKEIPLIRKFSRPYLDSRGLWFDADIAYTGGFSMILETKVNLFNLRNQIKRTQFDDEKQSNGSAVMNNGLSEENNERNMDKSRARSQSKMIISDKTAAFVSSEEDSAESSSYSEDSGDESTKHDSTWLDDNKIGTAGPPAIATASGSSKRLIRWVDKIARSPYFIKAADNKYIQRGMEMVSNTKLMLQVELHSVSGTLTINVPPPPSDRVWYGFRPSPIVKLSAKPKVGQKEISISKITDFIEKKLIVEFQRLLVLPNMEDVPLPLLVNGNINDYIAHFQ